MCIQFARQLLTITGSARAPPHRFAHALSPDLRDMPSPRTGAAQTAAVASGVGENHLRGHQARGDADQLWLRWQWWAAELAPRAVQRRPWGPATTGSSLSKHFMPHCQRLQRLFRSHPLAARHQHPQRPVHGGHARARALQRVHQPMHRRQRQAGLTDRLHVYR